MMPKSKALINMNVKHVNGMTHFDLAEIVKNCTVIRNLQIVGISKKWQSRLRGIITVMPFVA